MKQPTPHKVMVLLRRLVQRTGLPRVITARDLDAERRKGKAA